MAWQGTGAAAAAFADAAEGIGPAADADPSGLEGIEFVEYSTPHPQALGQVLELMGFHPVARHRSREVLLYRQGGMNIVVNAHDAAHATDSGVDAPAIAAVAFRFRDAAHAYHRALDRGAWAVPTRIEVMELNIPAIHGVGASRVYFVDRHREFSIYSVDFIPIPGADPEPPAVAGLHWFGLVHHVGADRIEEWTEFYRELFGFEPLPDDRGFGILPQGRILGSPRGGIHLQLVAHEPDAASSHGAERLQRIGFGAPDIPAAARALRERGVEFYDSERIHVEERGALTRAWLGGVMFELVRDPGGRAA